METILIKLRYSISPISQILYIHGKNPQFLSVEVEGNWPHIWTLCDPKSHHYPRKIAIVNRNDLYCGEGNEIISSAECPWRFYDEGPGTTEEFNSMRQYNVAPMDITLKGW